MVQVAITDEGQEAIGRRTWVSAVRALCDVADAQVLAIEAAQRERNRFQKLADATEARWTEAVEAQKVAQKRWELAYNANEQMGIKLRSLEKELLAERERSREFRADVAGQAVCLNRSGARINRLKKGPRRAQAELQRYHKGKGCPK